MKILSLIAAIALCAIMLSAGNPASLPPCAEEYYPETIKLMMKTQPVYYKDQDMSGKVEIKFIVNSDNTISVIDVDSENIYLENHTLQALNNHKIDNQCLDSGVVYAITVDFIYVI